MSGLYDLMSPTNFSNIGGGFVLGTVTDNSDKKNASMVKVEFTAWENGKRIHDWIPVLQNYAGKTYGTYIIPEIDDIVLVGFMGVGFQKPFVLGSFYPADAKFTNTSFDKKNLVKTIATKGGTNVSINDEEGKQSICVKTKKELTLT